MIRVLIAAAVVVGFVDPPARAAAIYGGPAYDSATGTGYLIPGLPVAPGSTAGNGVAVGYATRYDAGTNVGPRAVRWDATGDNGIGGGDVTELDNLGEFSGYTYCLAYAVNPAGTAVGLAEKYTADDDIGPRAVRWDAGGTAVTELDHLGTDARGYTYSLAYAVNAAGTAVGLSEKYVAGTDVGSRAIRWDAGGTAATELGTLGTDGSGRTDSYAFAVNAAGTAVGFASKYVSGTGVGARAVRWNAGDTAAVELGDLGTSASGTATSFAYAVNAAGVAAGFAEKFVAGTDVGARAVRWDAATAAATELGDLGTNSGGSTNSYAYAINAAGAAVGYATKYVAGTGVGERAVRWDAGGTVATELGNLGTNADGVATGHAFAVNAAGTAVGDAEKYTAGTRVGYRAVAWGLDGVAVDLNTLLPPADAARWTLTQAVGISDTNWVTGTGDYDPDAAGPLSAYARAFLIKMALAGDADGDDDVDFNDFLVLQTAFGSTETDTAFSPADFNHDGVTDFNDFLILQSHFGSSLGGSAVALTAAQTAAVSAFGLANAVPEPTAVGLIGLALLPLRRRRCWPV